MAPKSPVAPEFTSRFVKAMNDTFEKREKTTKEKETDYYNLIFFIHGLKRTQDFDACLDRYLNIYSAHLPADRRSKFIFTILLTSRLNATAPDDKYLQTLSAELAGGKQAPSPIKPRVDTLEEAQKHEILSIIKTKLETKKEKETILDELKKAFADKSSKKEPTLEQLYAFDPLPDPQLQATFNGIKALASRPSTGFENYGHRPNQLGNILLRPSIPRRGLTNGTTLRE